MVALLELQLRELDAEGEEPTAWLRQGDFPGRESKNLFDKFEMPLSTISLTKADLARLWILAV